MGVNFTPRFFVFKELKANDTVVISGNDAHHIIKVLRHKPGDLLKLSDGNSTEATAVIKEIDIKNLQIKTEIIEKNIREKIKPVITLFQGLPKGDKFDFILQKNTELGVAKFVPIITERTVVDLSQKKLSNRMQRWKKIVEEASKQCMRLDVPQVAEVEGFDESLKDICGYNIAIIPWEEEKSCYLKSILTGLQRHDALKIAVFIGPEGGFTSAEIEKAKKSGAVPVSLGSRILRTETASVAVCAAIMYELGELGGRNA
ncbi:MAG TPA: 16S rRNA (uracil(1498)-N(3))-methyltransferase [Thermoanaerobacterales bacterium]|nr:16S rRNA (uracil(1498)-N(3))-methyltransferase [Thermoanaerobacterales bacterium]